jgi:hypothetical protein
LSSEYESIFVNDNALMGGIQIGGPSPLSSEYESIFVNDNALMRVIRIGGNLVCHLCVNGGRVSNWCKSDRSNNSKHNFEINDLVTNLENFNLSDLEFVCTS